MHAERHQDPGAHGSGVFLRPDDEAALGTAFAVSLLLHLAALSLEPPASLTGAALGVSFVTSLGGESRLEARLRPPKGAFARGERVDESGAAKLRESPPSNAERQTEPSERTERAEQAAANASILPTAAPSATETPTANASAAEETFLDARRLDVRPAIRTRTMPEFPPTLPLETSGTVVVELAIAASGRVVAVRVIEGSGFAEMDAAAVAAFMAAEYDPGRIGGTPVPSRIRVTVRFDGGG